MYADLFNNAIVLTKSEARNAGQPTSDEYAEFIKLRNDFPGYTVKIAAAPKKTNRIKGLTYEYMEQYLKNNHNELMAEFYEMCGKDENGKRKELAAAATYGEIKMWFLTKCPEIEAMSERVNKIVDEARKARAEARAAKKSA